MLLLDAQRAILVNKRSVASFNHMGIVKRDSLIHDRIR